MMREKSTLSLWRGFLFGLFSEYNFGCDRDKNNMTGQRLDHYCLGNLDASNLRLTISGSEINDIQRMRNDGGHEKGKMKYQIPNIRASAPHSNLLFLLS